MSYTAKSEKDDIAHKFMKELEKDVQFIYDHFLKYSSQKMIFTTEDKEKI